jgi:hypothetical protein
VETGEPNEADSVAVLFSTRFEWEIHKDLDFDLEYRLQLVPDTLGDSSNTRATFSMDLWGDLDLDVTGTWDRVGSPERDAGGARPKSDDFRLLVGVGWDF